MEGFSSQKKNSSSLVMRTSRSLNTFFVVMYILLNWLFCDGVKPVNNVVMVSGGRQRYSAIRIHVSILPQTPLPSVKPTLLCTHFPWTSPQNTLSSSRALQAFMAGCVFHSVCFHYLQTYFCACLSADLEHGAALPYASWRPRHLGSLLYLLGTQWTFA